LLHPEQRARSATLELQQHRDGNRQGRQQELSQGKSLDRIAAKNWFGISRRAAYHCEHLLGPERQIKARRLNIVAAIISAVDGVGTKTQAEFWIISMKEAAN
jgi:hypothetical protein